MNEDVRQKILQWISENHMHHDYEVVLRGGTLDEYDEEWVDCQDADYPYVNSMDLEKFIKEL